MPATQALHAVAPDDAFAYLPAPHVPHTDDAVAPENLPETHEPHTDDAVAPVVADAFPASQSVHTVTPVV